MNQSDSLKNWMYLAQSAGKIARTRYNWFSFSLTEKLARKFLANHQSVANVIARFISTVIWNCFITIIIKPRRLKIGRVVPFKVNFLCSKTPSGNKQNLANNFGKDSTIMKSLAHLFLTNRINCLYSWKDPNPEKWNNKHRHNLLANISTS